MRWDHRVWRMMMGGLILLMVVGCSPEEETDGPTDEGPIDPPGIGNPGMDDQVSALVQFGDDLIAGGVFHTAGGDSAQRVAAWNGSAWRPLGRGIGGDENARVSAMTTLTGVLTGGRQQDLLLVGGEFVLAGSTEVSNLAAWNGTDWDRFAGLNGTSGPINVFATWNDTLVIGGAFAGLGGTPANNVVQYDGAVFRALGDGVDGSVSAIAQLGNELIVGGEFSTAGGLPAQNVARWDGTTWREMGGGFDNSVLDMIVYDDDLYATGTLTNALGTWSTGPADASLSGDNGRYASLDYDPDDAANIAYYANGSLGYTRIDNGVATSEIVDDEGDVGRYARLVAFQDGGIHVAYYDATNGNLKYAFRFPGGGWNKTIVDSGFVDLQTPNRDVGRYCSIALDDGGQPSIAYYDSTNGELWAARRVEGQWTRQVVDDTNGEDVGRWTAIAIDQLQRMQIAYYNATSNLPWYALGGEGAWVREEMGDRQGGQYLSMDIDAVGNPHVAFQNAATTSLWYQTKADGAWTASLVEFGGDVGRFASLKLDTRGTPLISYEDEAVGLKLATQTSTAWNIITLDDTPGSGYWTSLAFEDERDPRVAYYDSNTTSLRLAQRSTAVPTPRISRWNGSVWVEVSGGLDAWGRTLLDANGELMIGGFFQEAGGVSALRVASWNGSSWAPVRQGLNNAVWSLVEYRGHLIAAGGFTQFEQFTANGIYDLSN